jgi:GT2 family glycosyltransferase
MEAAPKVGNVVITTANGMKWLPVLLPSIAGQTYGDHETTVVLDGADRTVLEYLSSDWPEIQVVPIPVAGGFARAIDRGVRASRGTYIGVLNDDVELEPEWLERLVSELDAEPRVGFATGKTLLYDDREVINETYQDLHTCGRFVPRGLLEKDIGQYDRPRPATIGSASASVYRRRAVEDAGGFDTDYGFYCEDADLCLRMILRGYRGRYIPEARAYHAWAPSVGRHSETAALLGQRNTLITIAKDFPGPLLLRSLPKILRYQVRLFKEQRDNGTAGVMLKALASFIRALPRTLRKRRQVMQQRSVSSEEFGSFLIAGYPH